MAVLPFASMSASPTASPLHSAAAGTNVWVEVSPAVSPTPRTAPVMAYDSTRSRFLMFGGGYQLNDTWSYDPTANRWTNLGIPGAEATTFEYAVTMAYDAGADRFILFGAGAAGQAETWGYNPVSNVWGNLQPSIMPPARHDAGMAYDAAADRTILFGGGDVAPQHFASAFNDTWAYDARTNLWTNLHPSVVPDRRYGAAMVYDSVAGQILLFGGCANGLDFVCTLVNDTWTYDYASNRWTNLTPAPAPGTRALAAAAYDPADDVTVLFGGTNGTGLLLDTWAYDRSSNRWTNQNPSPSPPARQRGTLAFGPSAGRFVMFGGSLSTSWTPANDTWTYTSAFGGPGFPGGGAGTSTFVLGLTLILAAPAGAAVLWLLWRRGSGTRGR